MDKTLKRKLRSAEIDSQRSEDLRSGTPEQRHAAAVALGKKGMKKAVRKTQGNVHRLGGLARVRASRAKGGSQKTEKQLAARRLNAAKATAARMANAARARAARLAQEMWEKQVPTDLIGVPLDLNFQ